MCLYVRICKHVIHGGGGGSGVDSGINIEGRPVLARGRGTAYVPSGSRGKGQGLLKLLGVRNLRSL